MPRGPKGEKRSADVIGAAVMIGKIAAGEVDDHGRRQERRCRRARAHGRQSAGGRDVGQEAERDCPEGRRQTLEKVGYRTTRSRMP